MAFELTTEKKRKKTFDVDVCILCNGGVRKNIVLKPQETSRRVVIEAALRRKDPAGDRISSLGAAEKSLFKWHRECYMTYTSEINIRRCEKKQEEDDNPVDASSLFEVSTYRGSADRNFDPKKCIFCQKNTYRKDSKVFRISEQNKALNLLNECHSRQDAVFTRLCHCKSVKDIFAADVMYHSGCSKNYFRHSVSRCETSTFPDDLTPEDDSSLQSGFRTLIEEIGEDLQSKCFELTALTTRLRELCHDSREIDNRLTKKLLIAHYGEQLLFSVPKDRSKSSLVFKISVPLPEVAEEIRKIRTNQIELAAGELREEMKKQDFHLKNYICDSTNIENGFNDFVLPEKWNNFFNCLIRGTHKYSSSTKRKLCSIYMDLYHVLTNGNLTPKHIASAQSIHHLTRSKHLIITLNRLGHCISYGSMEILDQEIATTIVEASRNGDVPLPSNIVKDPSLFVHGAIDNDDFNEETLDGKATTHITAMVLYQITQKIESLPYTKYKPYPAPETTLKSDSFSTLPCQLIQKCLAVHKTPELAATHYVEMKRISPSSITKSNFLWTLCRMLHKENHSSSILPSNPTFPGWTPFHQCVSKSNVPKTIVGFCTTIPSPPSNIDTVYTALKNFMNLNSQLKRKYSVLSCDMQVYLLAKKIIMQSTEFNNLILRVGTFHVAKIWLTVLGQYLNGSGVEDLFIESGVYGENTVRAILHGLQYNRGVRAHKLLYEAIRRIQMKIFLQQQKHLPKYRALIEIIQQFQEVIFSEQAFSAAAYYNVLYESCTETYTQFQEFILEKSNENETFKFWSNYCMMVDLLLDCIRADRDGLWDLHLETVNKMIPYFFMFNHTNYIRGCILYLQDMANLPESILCEFKQGYFSVKRSDGKFNAVATDQALEQSLIRSSKVHGGVIGITANRNALQKWMLLYQSKASINSVLNQFCGLSLDAAGEVEDFSCHEWSESRLKRDENDVQRIIHFIQTHDNFYEESTSCYSLRNMVSGVVANEEVTKFLLNLREEGEKLYNTFLSERIYSKTKNIFSPIPRMKQLTFSYLLEKKKKVMQKSNAEYNDLNFIFILAGQRSFDLDELFQHELMTYPPALATRDGYLKKSVKAELMSEIERDTTCAISSVQTISKCTEIHIFDGMALIHSVPKAVLLKMETFENFGSFFINRILSVFHKQAVSTVHVIFDRYDVMSIKSIELEQRENVNEPLLIDIQSKNTHIPKQWYRFLSTISNKQKLVSFLTDFMMENVNVPAGKLLFCAGGFSNAQKCFQKNDCQLVEEVYNLQCNHLEADTRMYFHALYGIKHNSSSNFCSIFIHSPDTDVFVLGIRFWQDLKLAGAYALWVVTGVAEKKRYLGCHIVNSHYGHEICHLLRRLHGWTGCDTTSKIGTKKAALKLFKNTENFRIALKTLTLDINEKQINTLEYFYLRIIKKQGVNCDDSRKTLFTTKPKCVGDMSTLPCTSDSFTQHVLRSAVQIHLWENSLKSEIFMPDLTKYGYHYDQKNILRPLFMKKPALPPTLVFPCKCTKNCRNNCTCQNKGYQCVGYCACGKSQKCQNFLMDDDEI